jgi:hypothetical protein
MDTLFFTAEVNVITRNVRIRSRLCKKKTCRNQTHAMALPPHHPQFLAHLRKKVMDVRRECAKNGTHVEGRLRTSRDRRKSVYRLERSMKVIVRRRFVVISGGEVRATMFDALFETTNNCRIKPIWSPLPDD